MPDISLIMLCSRHTRNSVNALVGAVETGDDFASVEVRLPRDMVALEADLAGTMGQRRVIVGISVFSFQLEQTGESVRQIRNRFGPEVLLVAGGPHSTADPLGVLQLGFDLVVRGEGEQTIRDLLAAVRNGRDWRAVHGIAFMDGTGRLCRTPPQPPVRLDDFAPFPVRRRKAGPIEITRGCPFACSYCQTSHLFGAKPRHRSVSAIVRAVELMCSRGRADVRVVSPDAFAYGSPDGRAMNLAALAELLSAMRRSAGAANRIYFGSFPSEVRPEHVNDEALELVRRFADNDNLIIGAQSGSQRVLDSCCRSHTVDDVVNAARLTVRHGVTPVVDFIFGLPGEEEQDELASIELIRELAALGASIRGHVFTPLPQTPFAGARSGRIGPRAKALLGQLHREGKASGLWWGQGR